MILEKFYSIENAYFFARYTQRHEYVVEFEAWEVIGLSDPPLYGEISEGLSADPNEVTPFVTGHVKWDGCSNFDFPESEESMLHACDRQGLTRIGVLLGRIWDQCISLCPNAEEAEVLAEDIVEDTDFPWNPSESRERL